MTTPAPPGFRALRDDAIRELTRWSAPDAGQESLRVEYLAHLAAHLDAMWRHGPPAHLTVGLLVLDEPGDRVLLTLHRKAREWYQLGGHLEEGDPSVAAAALREGVEESGIAGVRLLPGIVHLDRHALPDAFGTCREHLDVRYLAVAPAGSMPMVSEESLDVAWFAADELPNQELVPVVAAAQQVLRATGPA